MVESSLAMRDVLKQAGEQLADFTDHKSQSVTGACKDEQGWRVRIEVLEMARIPAATDVLAEYEVLLGDDGCVLSFERKGARLRGETMKEAS